MARNAGTAVENNFTKGLITQATGLNFPENAVTDSLNVKYDYRGIASRREGIDLEESYTALTVASQPGDAFVEYVWKGVAGDGQRTFLVQQIGQYLLFFNSNGSQAVSNNYLGAANLSSAALESGTNLSQSFCQFSAGLGYLIVSHPYCETFYVAYDPNTGAISVNVFQIKTRDFRGVDPLDIPRTNPLSQSHWYNLRNQGWSNSHIFDWSAKIGTYPSDFDVWWLYKTPDAFGIEQFLVDVAVAGGIVNNVNRGNSPAPKGSVILTEFYQDRSGATGVNGIPIVSSGNNRPSTSAFHAGRVFYSGVNSKEYTSKVYFSQIIQNPTHFEKCYQENDPTSQFSPDLLPTDGGVIAIANAGRVYRLWSTNNSLLVFASQGVWEITGSQGIGFSATDYTVKRISSAATNSPLSFVDVDGMPVWWGLDDIWVALSDTRLGGISIKSLTQETIQAFYEDIPDVCRSLAKGSYSNKDRTVQWVYRTTAHTEPSTRQNYDGILVFDTRTQSFSPWTIPTSPAAVKGICVLQGQGSVLSSDLVTDLGAPVTDMGVVVTDASLAPTVVTAQFKYTTQLGPTSFSYSEPKEGVYRDWSTLVVGGTVAPAFFVSGYRIRGDAMRDQQSNYMTVYGTPDPPSRFTVRCIWDYALDEVAVRWSTPQMVFMNDQKYQYRGKKLKLRGHGKSVQFRVDSVDDYDFNIIGWSTYDTVNAGV